MGQLTESAGTAVVYIGIGLVMFVLWGGAVSRTQCGTPSGQAVHWDLAWIPWLSEFDDVPGCEIDTLPHFVAMKLGLMAAGAGELPHASGFGYLGGRPPPGG